MHAAYEAVLHTTTSEHEREMLANAKKTADIDLHNLMITLQDRLIARFTNCYHEIGVKVPPGLGKWEGLMVRPNFFEHACFLGFGTVCCRLVWCAR